MAQTYDTAADRRVLLDNEPLNLRTFELVLVDANMLATKRVDFDRTHETVADVIGGDDFALNAVRIALRTQLIRRPLDPADMAPKILQFFAVDPNNNALVDRRNHGILIEKVGQGEDIEEWLLVLLNPDEVWNIAHGDGFSMEVQTEDQAAK
jgi:hypothetical protein